LRAAPRRTSAPDLILGNEHELQRLFDHGVQIVYSGKAHPRDLAGKALVGKLLEAARRDARHVVFLENYDMRIGALDDARRRHLAQQPAPAARGLGDVRA